MDAVELVIPARRRPVGSGEVARLLPHRLRRMVGPFIFVDHIGPDTLAPGVAVDVDAHPHIGLSTLTYLFDGRLEHRDSIGSVQTIEAGAANWMTAGSGVTHTERSLDEDRDSTTSIHGLQTWVALPEAAEETEPAFDHQPAAAIPEERFDGAEVRVIAGTAFGLESPVPVSSPLVLAHVRMSAEGTVRLERGPRERALLALSGVVAVAGQTIPHGAMAVLEAGSEPVLSGSGEVVLIGGEPVGKRHIWWNFVHSDPERIEDAKQRWIDQRFPEVPGDHFPFTPLPG